MSESVTEFYDRLSPVFHHSMGYDWEAGVRWEGEWLDRFLAEQLGAGDPFRSSTVPAESEPRPKAWRCTAIRSTPRI